MFKKISSLMLLALVAYAAQAQPIDRKATPETKNLYRNLSDLHGKGIMFGHQDDLAYGIKWKYEAGRSDVKEVCGDFPAVYGWELGGIELGGKKSLDSVPFDKIRQFVNQVYSRGGINTISWHLHSPVTGGNAWDVSSKSAVKNILPGGPQHQAFIRYLDRLAAFLRSLKTNKGVAIPVIFRPWHEHTGSWFWWGKDLCTADEYKALWKFTIEYLHDNKQLHNLLYAYSPSSPTNDAGNYMERYPGNQYVDILGVDIYQGDNEPNKSFGERLVKELKLMSTLATENKKLYTLTEIGFNTIPDANWWTTALLSNLEGYQPLYMLFWRNANDRPNHYFAPYPNQVSAPDFVKMYKSGKVLFQQHITKMNMYK